MEIVAEIGTSHQGDIAKAKELIFAAAQSGATAIKFQWVYADEILHPATGFVHLPGGKIPLYERFKSLEVKPDFFAECLEYTHKADCKFLCSPFGLRSLQKLVGIKPDMVKIASPELNYVQLLQKTAELCRDIPVVISSGVSKLSDIETALEVLCDGGLKKENVTLLHCSTAYPTPEEEYNVRLVKNLSRIFDVSCGISDHSLDAVLVPVLSVLCGGQMIEKHIALSNDTDGLDDPVALTPEKFSLMCHAVNQTLAVIGRHKKEEAALKGGSVCFEKNYVPRSAFDYVIKTLCEEYPIKKINACLGSGQKILSESERQNYGRTNRSIHFMRDLKKGSVIAGSDVAILRTEKILSPGLHPKFLNYVIGSQLCRDVKSGEGTTLECIIHNETQAIQQEVTK